MSDNVYIDNGEKWFYIACAIGAIGFFTTMALPLAIEKYQDGEVAKMEFQKEIALIQAGNVQR